MNTRLKTARSAAFPTRLTTDKSRSPAKTSGISALPLTIRLSSVMMSEKGTETPRIGRSDRRREVKADILMTALARGDRSSFDELYRCTSKTVYHIALGIVRDRALAEDVMQSTYLSVLRNSESYRAGTNAAAWIARIARNEALNVYNKRKREESVDEREHPEAFGTAHPDEYGLLVDLARRILPEEEFTVLLLIAADGYKRREVSEMLSMPVPTVTWKYKRALSAMKEALKEEKSGLARKKKEGKA